MTATQLTGLTIGGAVDSTTFQVTLNVDPTQTFNLTITGFMAAVQGDPPATPQEVADTIAATDTPNFSPNGYLVSADCRLPTLRAVVDAASSSTVPFRF